MRRDEFLDWARRVASACQLWNPLPMLEWNSHKGYLLNLERSGVPVVPTVLVEQGTRGLLSDIVNDRSWGDVIVKPAVGADAWQVARGSRRSHEVAQAQLDRILADGDALVQPYFSSVEPYLFFGLAPHAAERLAQAIASRLRR